MPCYSCARFFHNECEEGCETCHGEQDKLAEALKRVGPTKSADQIIDPHSTGRKRAKILFPIPKDHTGKAPPCEWQRQKNCGGGFKPIVGCLKGRMQDRHHGPDKNTLNNSEENVHRICKTCHHRWHAENDPAYGTDQGKYKDNPHNPEPATELELQANELNWRMRK